MVQQILVYREGEPLRTITPEQAVKLIALGALSYNDRAFTENLTRWRPLGEIPEVKFLMAEDPEERAAALAESEIKLPWWVSLRQVLCGLVLLFVPGWLLVAEIRFRLTHRKLIWAVVAAGWCLLIWVCFIRPGLAH